MLNSRVFLPTRKHHSESSFELARHIIGVLMYRPSRVLFLIAPPLGTNEAHATHALVSKNKRFD